MNENWRGVLGVELTKPYFVALNTFIKHERENFQIFPPHENVLEALKLTPLEQVKVVILGQDPYHGDNQAHGLAFSVQRGVVVPPSLVNVYKELSTDSEGFIPPKHGNLTTWAEQGVLLLNTVLTVRAHQAGSHRGQGWESFTSEIVAQVAAQDRPIAFLLWGADARKKKQLISDHSHGQHLILEAPHPSPLSAHTGFFGSKHFSQANTFLATTQQEPINWQLPN